MTQKPRPTSVGSGGGMADTGRWQSIDEIFHQAWERPDGERSAFLDEACQGDVKLRNEIESLLAAADAPPGWLDGSGTDQALGLLAADPSVSAGSEIGRYRILGPLGRGGMGAVYLAERRDDQYDQQVALKIIKRGMDTDFLIARFRRERQILAQLNHPSIARLIDGGATRDGRPYLVMEYVEGQPINLYVRHQDLDVDQRLELFYEICDAVRYSHRNLIIHRDLKPSNILVTPEGRPKLLDFGTAKLTADVGGTQTAFELRILTPGYASPEQIRGGPITTVSDVFSLGILLYELLSDVPAFSPAGTDYQKIAMAVCETEPAKLSQVAPKARRKRLQGDLDAIVSRAIRKEAAARYESVTALMDDLDRHRAAQPIRARRGTIRYRAGRFFRRNRLVTVAAALVAMLAVSFMVALVIERRETEREKVRTEAIKDYLQSLFEDFDPFQSEVQPVTAREMLERGVDRIDRELSGQPELELEILGVLAEIYGNLGHREEAKDLVIRALAVQAQKPDKRPWDRGRLLNLLAHAEIGMGDLESAKGRLEEASEIFQQLGQSRDLEAAKNLSLLGTVYRLQGQHPQALDLLQAALRRLRSASPMDDEEVDKALIEIGMVLRMDKNFVTARRFIEEAVERIRQRYGESHLKTINAKEALGTVLFDLGDWQTAQGLMDGVLETRRSLLGEEHPEVIASFYNLGALAVAQGRYEQAAWRFAQTLERMRSAFEHDHPQLVFALMWASRVALDRGRIEEARSFAEEAGDRALRAFGPQRAVYLSCLHILSQVERAAGKGSLSRRILDQTLDLIPQQPPSESAKSMPYTYLYLAEASLEEDKLQAAVEWLAKLEANPRANDPQFASRRRVVAATLALRQEDLARAEEILRPVSSDESAAVEIPNRLRLENVRVAVELVGDQPRAAERRAREALALALETVGPQSLSTGQLEMSLALALQAQFRNEEALEHLRRAVDLLPASLDRPPQGGPSARQMLPRLEAAN